MAKTLIIQQADFSENKLDTVIFVRMPCTGVQFSTSEVSLTEIGQTAELAVNVTPVDTTDTLTITSSNTNVAIVENGTVKSVGIGTCTITATCGEHSDQLTIVSTATAQFVAVRGTYARRRSSSTKTVQFMVGSGCDDYVVLCRNDSDGLPIGLVSSPADPLNVDGLTACPILIPKGTVTIRVTSPYACRCHYIFMNSKVRETQYGECATATVMADFAYSTLAPRTATNVINIPVGDVSAIDTPVVNDSGTDSVVISIYSTNWPQEFSELGIVDFGFTIEFLSA